MFGQALIPLFVSVRCKIGSFRILRFAVSFLARCALVVPRYEALVAKFFLRNSDICVCVASVKHFPLQGWAVGISNRAS